MKRSFVEDDAPREPWGLGRMRRRLSARELEVALLIAYGLKDVVIARRLGLAVSTVGVYARRVRFKLGLGDRASLIAWVTACRSAAQAEAGRRTRRGEDALSA